MKEFELDSLEQEIDKLLASHQQLKLENCSLQKKISTLNNENVSLLGKKKQAAESVKKLILHLQDELQCQTQQ